jgi:ketosteroid isomerase-like protein
VQALQLAVDARPIALDLEQRTIDLTQVESVDQRGSPRMIACPAVNFPRLIVNAHRMPARRVPIAAFRLSCVATMTDDHAALQATLRDIDASVDQLASKGDFEALSALLASDFRYNHSTGKSENKTEWVEGLKRLVGQRDRVTSSIQVDVHGDVAMAMGDLDIVWKDGRRAYDRYVRVYRQMDGNWRVIFQRTLPAHDRAPATT